MSEKKCCPICNSKDTVVFANTTDLEYLSSETVYTYHECKSCSTIFIDEFPTDKLSEISLHVFSKERLKTIALKSTDEKYFSGRNITIDNSASDEQKQAFRNWSKNESQN